MISSTEFYMRTKVWVTFFIILAIVIAAVFWSYDSYKKLISSINQLSEPNKKTILIQNTIHGITKAENYIRLYILTNEPGTYDAYQDEIKEIQLNIDELKKKMAEDSLQIQKVDSLEILFLQKLNYLSDFLMTKKHRQAKNFSNEALEKITKSATDSTEVHSMVRTNLKTTEAMRPMIKKSIVETEYKEPGLIESIKRLFGAKNIRIDTVTRIENGVIRAIEISIDTLTITNYNQDTMLFRVKQILEEVANKEFQSQYLLSSKENKLLQQDVRLHTEIDKIIHQLKEYELDNLRRTRDEGNRVTRNSTRAVLTIGVSGIILGGFFLFAIGRDLTRSYYLSKRLELERNKSDHLAKRKEEFLSNMSHEIRTPLNSILGFSELMNKTKLNQKQQIYSYALSENTKYLIRIVNDILDFSKLDFKKLELSEEPFQLHDIVLQMESLFAIQCKEKGLELRTSYDPELNRIDLIGDEFRIKQILTNLLCNAVKFTDHGYVELNIKAQRKINQYNLDIKVTDTGKGIEPCKFKTIFNTFEQEDTFVGKKYGGTGLGLSIVKKLTEAMKGKIMVDSVLNEQTTFSLELCLPFKNHIEEEVSLYTPMREELVFDAHVVVIEDDQWNATLLRIRLSSKVRKLSVFENPNDALIFIKKHSGCIDMIMTDINMPQISGVDILNSLKSLDSTLPVIAITAHVLPNKVKFFSEIGFTTVITKPYDEETINRVLKENLKVRIKSSQTNHTSLDTGEKESLNFDFDNIKQFSGSDENLLVELVHELIIGNEKNMIQFRHFLGMKSFSHLSDIAHKMIQTYESLNLISIAESLKGIEVYYLLGRSEEMLNTSNELLPLLEKVADRLNEVKPQFYT